MKKEKLLPLFKDYMINSYENESYVVYNTPLDCQIISTIPNFIISDGFHKVPCRITKEAIIKVKEYYPAIKIRDLENLDITLLEYGPHTILEKYIRPVLHIYKFGINPLETQHNPNVTGKPKEITHNQEVKSGINFETIRHLRNSLASEAAVDKILPLESIIFNPEKPSGVLCTAISCEGKKAVVRDNAGKIIYTSEALERIEDTLVEAAGKRIASQKANIRKQKELARKLARQQREKPRSLSKDLISWANDWKQKKENTDINVIKEGVAKIIAKGNNVIGSVSKVSVNANSNKTAVEKVKGSQTEVEYNAKSFKKFLAWQSSADKHDSEENNVTELLKKSDPGDIRVDFTLPGKQAKKAFEGWISTVSGRRRESSEEVASCKKSSSKKPKL